MVMTLSSPSETTFNLQNILAANIDGPFDLHQRADASICPNVGLLARQQFCKNRVMHGPALVQHDAAVKAQEATFEHTIALRLEIRVHHADALIVRQIFQRRALGALPIGEVSVVEHDHAALDRDIGPRQPGGGDEARGTVVPGVADERFYSVGERHWHDLWGVLWCEADI